MEMKRLVSTVLAGVMALSLVACGESASTAPATDSGDAAPAAEAEAPAEAEAEAPAAEAAASGEPITLKMWCIATESDSNRHAYEEAIK